MLSKQFTSIDIPLQFKKKKITLFIKIRQMGTGRWAPWERKEWRPPVTVNVPTTPGLLRRWFYFYLFQLWRGNGIYYSENIFTILVFLKLKYIPNVKLWLFKNFLQNIQEYEGIAANRLWVFHNINLSVLIMWDKNGKNVCCA